MKNLSIVIATCACLLLCALAGRYVSGHWLFFTFASFQIQGAMLAAGLAALAWLFHRSIVTSLIVMASLAIAAHGYVMLGEYRQPSPMPPQSWPADLKVLSFNIMGDNSFENGGRIADVMISSGADVVMIQESAPLGPHIDRIKQTYPYRLGCGAETMTCDQSLWSKRPFLSQFVRTASPIYRDRFLMASIEFRGQRVYFANIHLTKPYFDNMHAVEMKLITNLVNDTQGPMVLAGDMNASVLTPDIRTFLSETGLMTADTEPTTWPVGLEDVGMAIDHMFVRGQMRFRSLERLPQTFGSNHHGLVAELWLQDPSITYPPQ